MRGAIAVTLAAAMVLGVASLRERFGTKPGVAVAGDRRAMGEVSFQTLDGGTWRLREHRGQVVAINLWATWCAPCREETPMLIGAVREMGPQGFGVVGVSMDEGDRERKVHAFQSSFGVNYPLAFPDALSQIGVAMQGVPTTILVDREGRVAKMYVGEVRGSVLRADVGTLLRER